MLVPCISVSHRYYSSTQKNDVVRGHAVFPSAAVRIQVLYNCGYRCKGPSHSSAYLVAVKDKELIIQRLCPSVTL
jgi:hypothetical protein